MNRWSAAVLAGVSILLAAQFLYIGVLTKVSFHEPLRLMLLLAPSLAAFVTAYFVPGRNVQKILAGMSMAVIGTLLGVLSSLVYRALGLHVDQIGGLVATFLVLLGYNSVAAAIGTALGVVFSRSGSRPAAADTTTRQ
jgi:hypothetical protein